MAEISWQDGSLTDFGDAGWQKGCGGVEKNMHFSDKYVQKIANDSHIRASNFLTLYKINYQWQIATKKN